LVAPNRLLYINPGESAKHKLHAVPSRYEAPRLSDINLQALRGAVRDLRRLDQQRVPDGELLDVTDLISHRLVYRRCGLVAFEAPDRTVVFRVLDRGKRLPNYEEVLTAMFPDQPEILPFERSEYLTLPSELSPLLPRELLEKADALDDERERLRAVIAR